VSMHGGKVENGPSVRFFVSSLFLSPPPLSLVFQIWAGWPLSLSSPAIAGVEAGGGPLPMQQ
jgi:hypothetical protein